MGRGDGFQGRFICFTRKILLAGTHWRLLKFKLRQVTVKLFDFHDPIVLL